MVREARRELSILIVLVVACLAPFAGKAFHIDDPLFLWTAEQIRAHPFDFFGFGVNWNGTVLPMAEVTKNPPLACYFIAGAATLVGWSELALHLAFLLPALAAAWGAMLVARELCRTPLLAAACAVLTPAFLVSSTSVMCDTMMLALWVWALFAWIRGLERRHDGLLALSGVLIALAVLTKYFAISLVPLLFVYTLARRNRSGLRAAWLLIPVIVLAGYEWLCARLYGQPLFLGAAGYSLGARQELSSGVTAGPLAALAFAGGGLMTALPFAPMLWARRSWIAGGAIVASLIVLFLALPAAGPRPWASVVQMVVLVAAGAHLLVLAAVDLHRRRDAGSLLLFIWVFGTFAFAALFNWTVNVRTVLPMVPAVGILIARRLEDLSAPDERPRGWRVAWPLVPAAVLGLLLSAADHRWADSARRAAETISRRYASESRVVWFDAHWGFQYYMQGLGGRAIDWKRIRMRRGDVLVLPRNNTGRLRIGLERLRQVETMTLDPWSGLTTMSVPRWAGFYSDVWGPLPFAIGPAEPEEYTVFEVR